MTSDRDLQQKQLEAVQQDLRQLVEDVKAGKDTEATRAFNQYLQDVKEKNY